MSDITKKALRNSLRNLLQKKALNKITVSDITNDCGVNRMTFYYHFHDIYDLVESVCLTEMYAIMKDKSEEHWAEGILEIFNAILENKQLIINVFRGAGYEQTENFLYKLLDSLTLKVVEERAENLNVPKADMQFIADFYKYAFTGILIQWIKTDMKENPEEIVERLKRICDHSAECMINNCKK